jgi:glycerol-3-phosphate responsive antiterminator
MVFAGSIPGLGPMLLRECLKKIHRDIITCWNFRDEMEVRSAGHILENAQLMALSTSRSSLVTNSSN